MTNEPSKFRRTIGHRAFPWVLPIAFLAIYLVQVMPSSLGLAQERSHSNSQAEENKDERIREGVKLNQQIGEFRIRGAQASFHTADGKREFGGLENLNLERIVRMIGEHPSRLSWIVSGEVTEYQGANFLLVTHALVRSKAAGNSTSKGRNGE